MSREAMPDISQIRPLGSFEERALSVIRKPGGTLRASRPEAPKGASEFEIEFYGACAYLWRMLAFHVSKRREHQCLPIMADCYLAGSYEARRQTSKDLDGVIDRWIKQVPPRQWHGIIRWGEALGQVGTPRLAQDGSIVYRVEE